MNIYEKHQKGISEIKAEQEHKPIYDCLVIGLTCERQELYRRIDERVDKMIQDGLFQEIQGLLDQGVTFEDQSMQAIGYKEYKAYSEGNRTLEECIDEIKKDSRNFAKRQYTFFKNQMDMQWFEEKECAMEMIDEWLYGGIEK